MEKFYMEVRDCLQKEHVLVFVDSSDNQFVIQEAQKLFSWLDDEILIDHINELEVVTKEGNFLCIRPIREQMYISSNPGYHLMLLPKEKEVEE